MIPVAPILIGIWFATRGRGRSDGTQGWWALRILTIPLAMVMAFGLVVDPEPIILPIELGLLLYSFPQPLFWLFPRVLPLWPATWLILPLATRWMSWDVRAGTVLVACWSPPRSSWRYDRLVNTLRGADELTSYGLVAEAVLHTARGEPEEARWRMNLVARLPAVLGLTVWRRFAQEWLVADAAACGNHDEAVALCAGVDWKPHPAVAALAEICAAAEAGHHPPRKEILRQLWYGRPRLAWECWASAPTPPAPPPADPPAPGSPFVAAARACAEWSARPGVQAPRMKAAATALDALLAVSPAEDAEREPLEAWVARQAQGFTERMVAARRLVPPGDSTTLQNAVAEARDKLWSELQDRVDELRRVARLRDREGAEEGLSPIEIHERRSMRVVRGRREVEGDWRMLADLVQLADTLDTDLAERRVLWSKISGPLWSVAVDTFNHRGQRDFGRMCFYWLVALGTDVAPEESLQTLMKNTRAS